MKETVNNYNKVIKEWVEDTKTYAMRGELELKGKPKWVFMINIDADDFDSNPNGSLEFVFDNIKKDFKKKLGFE